MKQFKIVVSVSCMLSCFNLSGQPAIGIYKSSSDFLSNTVFYADEKTHIHLHELLGKNHIELKHNDSVFKFMKKEVYGYCDSKGQAYRFFAGKTYCILNRSEKILIYKTSSGAGMKNSPLIESYFFSKEAGSDILALTIPNILSSFSDNSVFSALVEIYYKNEYELCNYDPVHHMYKINRLWDLSKVFKSD